MSTCISSHGEYDSHETDPDTYVCKWCHEFDETGALAEIARLRRGPVTGMEHAIEQAARIIHGCTGDEGGAPIAARALAEAGLLVPAPLREEWGRAYRQADGVLFVDDQDGSFRDSDDVAQFVPPQHPDSPYDLIVKRGATDWIPVARAEGESWYDAEPDAMPDAGWEPIEPVERAKGDAMNRQNTVVLARNVEAAEAAGYPRHRWCVVTPRNIKIGPRGMQARYAVAVDLADDEFNEMLVHDSVAPAFLWAGDPEVVRVTAEGAGRADQ